MVEVDNPDCDDPNLMPVITLEIKNGGTWTEVYKDSTVQSPTIEYCPPFNIGLVEYRVKFSEPFKDDEPYCGGEGPYIEGYTMFSGSEFIKCCEDCPPSLFNDVLSLWMQKSNDCPDNGCIVSHSLNLPSGYNCFTGYKVVTDSGSTGIIPFYPIPGDTLEGIDRCIAAGTTYNASVTLYTNGGIDSCTYSSSVTCPEPRDTTDLMEPCKPDCENDAWIGPKTGIFGDATSCPPENCLVAYTYYYRDACNGEFQDIQITKMQRSNNCASCPESDFYQSILREIINKNVMDFDPKEQGCDTTWRISHGGCWSDYTQILIDLETFEHDTVIINEPCVNVDCCLQRMKVCKDSVSMTTSIEYLPTDSPNTNCDSTWLENPYMNGWIIPCYPACNWLDGFDSTYVTPPELKRGIEEKVDDYYKDKIGLGVEHTINESTIDLVVRSFNINEILIEITDINGKIIYRSEEYINSEKEFIQIEKNKFLNGAYLLNIYSNGHRFSTEKLLITK